MEKYIQQDSEFVCSVGGSADKMKIFALVPLTIGCPIWKQQYDRYNLNGVHGAFGEVDPQSINFNLVEKGINNGYKGYDLGSEGIDSEWALTIMAGGDNSFENRMGTLQDDAGGYGGQIIQNIIIEVHSPVTLSDGSVVNKIRYYQIKTDTMDVFGTSLSDDTEEFEWALKIINRPKVFYEFDPTTLKGNDEVALTVTDTLTFDPVTGMVSGDIEVAELEGIQSKVAVHLMDTKDRGNTIMFGSSQEVESMDGVFTINVAAPIVEDSETVQLNAVIAGRNILFTEFTVNEAPTGYMAVSGITPQTATVKFDIEDNSGVIGDKQVSYTIKDSATDQVVSTGNMKATSLRSVKLDELKPNRRYDVSLKFNSTELATQEFKTGKDITPPVISVTSSKIEVPVGTIVDYDYHVSNNGLKAIDDIDGELTKTSFEIETLDTTKVGEYLQGVHAKDSSGNKAIEQITIVVK